jgi:hypothetical protein
MRWVRRTSLWICAAALAWPTLSFPASPLATGLECDEYKKLNVVIEELSETAAQIGLTPEALRDKTELRLRAAGVEPDGESPVRLNVNATVTRSSYSLDLQLKRRVTYKARGSEFVSYSGSTWSTGMTGLHAGNPRAILDDLDAKLDVFLNEYLRVNQELLKASSTTPQRSNPSSGKKRR